jgi:hypothetical protein
MKPATARHVQFRSNKAGALVPGRIPVELAHFDTTMHMHRAVWLTSAMEAPKWGTVQSYDGAGMSGGLIHHIALAPKTMEQGSFFGLLRRIELTTVNLAARKEIASNFASEGCFVAQDGRLRATGTGRLVTGHQIRKLFTPPSGNVPSTGPAWEQAKRWALLFNKLFEHRDTYRAQIEFAAEWMARGNALLEWTVYTQAGVAGDSPIGVRADTLEPIVDLALCVYHSFSVNAPGAAAKILERTRHLREPWHELVRGLGRSNYGAWRAKRYPATRRAARLGAKAGLWSEALVRDLLPASL